MPGATSRRRRAKSAWWCVGVTSGTAATTAGGTTATSGRAGATYTRAAVTNGPRAAGSGTRITTIGTRANGADTADAVGDPAVGVRHSPSRSDGRADRDADHR